MKYAKVLRDLDLPGGDSWAIYKQAQQMSAAGHDIVDLSIGEPDIPTPPSLIEDTCAALHAGRTGYSSGAGEAGLRKALAVRYSRSAGRGITSDQVLCFPGTQTALYAVMRGIAGPGDEVLVGDPMYATYASVIAASGASMVPVPLSADNGFRMRAADIAARITPHTTAIFLNTPHNPTGAVLTAQDIAEIGEVARAHDLWILSDEVYDEMLFDGASFTSPLANPDLADRVIVVASISKSHGAPGFRSGWAVASAAFCAKLLPLSEAMLFGNQPFIADATAKAIAAPSTVAPGMCQRFSARAERLAALLHAETKLRVHQPKAGMFALVNVAATGLNGADFAQSLLDEAGVCVMPGASFGTTLNDWVRVALTRPDAVFDQGCQRIVAFANGLAG